MQRVEAATLPGRQRGQPAPLLRVPQIQVAGLEGLRHGVELGVDEQGGVIAHQRPAQEQLLEQERRRQREGKQPQPDLAGGGCAS